VERVLQSDLDELDLSDRGCENISRQLSTRGLPKKSVQNCLSALRAYAQLDGR
jgi:site-specific recombinase XerC